MVHTKKSQRQAKQSIDEKLELSSPSQQLLENLTSQCAKNPSPDNTFQYAFCLSKSKNSIDELHYSIKILDSLLKEGYDYQVDCMYGCATAFYLLGEYNEARERCEAILRSEPDHSGTVELHLACIEAAEQAEEERIRKVSIAGSVAVASVGLVVGIAGMLLKKR